MKSFRTEVLQAVKANQAPVVPPSFARPVGNPDWAGSVVRGRVVGSGMEYCYCGEEGHIKSDCPHIKDNVAKD